MKVGSPVHVSRMLATLGRKLHPILGDGNCFFRALSYIMYGTEDCHTSVQASIALFSELNVDCFKKYCTSSVVMEHIRCMKHEAVFATQMEAHAAASCIFSELCTYTLRKVEMVSIIGKSLTPSHHTLSSCSQLSTEYCCIPSHPLLLHCLSTRIYCIFI